MWNCHPRQPFQQKVNITGATSLSGFVYRYCNTLSRYRPKKKQNHTTHELHLPLNWFLSSWKADLSCAGQPTFIKLRHNTVFVQRGVVLPVGKQSARLRLELGGLVRNVDLGPRQGMRGCSECQTVWGNQGAEGYDGCSLCPLRWCFGLVVLRHYHPLLKC